MYPKYGGFALVLIIVLAACHNIFIKDKSKKQQVTVAKNIVVIQDSVSVVSTNAAQSSKDSALRYIYLTFDDGPQPGTINTYDICKQKGVKATFFLIGIHAEEKPGKNMLDTMKVDLRHFLFANHSYTHANHNHYDSFYGHPEDALKDFIKTQDTLNLSTNIARLPGNNSWAIGKRMRTTKLTRSLSKLMDSAGYAVMGWDVEWKFGKQNHPVQSAEEMAKEVENAFADNITYTKNHIVLLAHDRMFKEQAYADSLSKMISILQSKQGYIFETADQYPLLKKQDKQLLAVRK
jgi:peptidoglycan/xylan/chitin deacetylase (PgdA/CDA1 family)